MQPGTYRELVLVREKHGRLDAYILIQGQPGAVLSGAAGHLDRWQAEGGGIYSAAVETEPDGSVGYVAAGEERLYRYATLEALRGGAPGVKGGWNWNGRRLFVLLPNGGDPARVPVRAAIRPHAFRLLNSSYQIIEGFEMGYFGSAAAPRQEAAPRLLSQAVTIENSSHIVIRRNRIHHANHGVATHGAGARRILVEENEIYDTSIVEWPWDRVKRTDAEGGAVSLKGGPGQVVRRNRIRGYFNGITASTWGSLADEARNSDLDIYENQLESIGDDPIEPEGACINLRIWANTIRHSLTAVSLAPITVGPVYVLRNTSFQHSLTAVKFGSGEDNFGAKYILHNTFVTTLRRHRKLDGTLVEEGVTAAAIWPHRAALPFNRPYPAASWANATFLNNIFAGTRYALEAASLNGEATFDYNNLYTAGHPHLARLREVTYPDLASLRSAGYEQHGLSHAPRFVDLTKGDLRLATGSPEIDKARPLPNINDDFFGAAPDIGALEWRARSRVFSSSQQ